MYVHTLITACTVQSVLQYLTVFVYKQMWIFRIFFKGLLFWPLGTSNQDCETTLTEAGLPGISP